MSETEGGTTVKLREEASSMGEAVQRQASEARENAARELRTQVTERTAQAGRQTRALAEALRRSGSEVESRGETGAARVASAAADRLERAGTYLERVRGDELLGDAERLVRRRPWLVAALAAAAGFAASRFLKASSERRHESSRARPATPARRHEPASGRPVLSSEYPDPPTVPVGAPGVQPSPEASR